MVAGSCDGGEYGEYSGICKAQIPNIFVTQGLFIFDRISFDRVSRLPASSRLPESGQHSGGPKLQHNPSTCFPEDNILLANKSIVRLIPKSFLCSVSLGQIEHILWKVPKVASNISWNYIKDQPAILGCWRRNQGNVSYAHYTGRYHADTKRNLLSC